MFRSSCGAPAARPGPRPLTLAAALVLLCPWAALGHANDTRALAGEVQCPLSGVVFNLALADLPNGWVLHYDATYSDVTVLSDMRPGQGHCLLWGAMRVGLSELEVGAFGERAFIEAVAAEPDGVGLHNGVVWYTKLGLSAGFSRSDVIDVTDVSPGDTGPYDCAQRLSWLLNGHGGYRAGCNEDLGTSASWRKIVMHGPAVQRCAASDCGPGLILKSSGDLPGYCRDIACSAAECCQDARTCSRDVCGIGWLPSLAAPQFCAAVLCTAEECCQAAPRCERSVCTDGFILRPAAALPAAGCQGYACTVAECCIESPVCPLDACDEAPSIYLAMPPKNCTSPTCSTQDCCLPADACAAGMCPVGYGLSRAALANVTYCRGGRCELSECCVMQVPTVGVTSVNFQDADLTSGFLGGDITWVRASTEEVVTELEVHLGTLPNATRLLGVTLASAEVFQLPPGTPYEPFIFVWTTNPAGRQPMPASSARIADAAVTVKDVQFTDLDPDPGDIGGIVNWSEPFQDVEAGLLKEVCIFKMPLSVETGPAGATFASAGERRTVSPPGGLGAAEGVIFVAAWASSLAAGLPAATVGSYRTGLAAELAALQQLFEGLPIGSTVLLGAVGGGWAALPLALRDAVARLGGREFEWMADGDFYSLIGRRTVGGELSPGVAQQLLRAADVGRPAAAAAACPFARYEVALSTSDGSRTQLLGTSELLSNSLAVPPETPRETFTRIAVYAVSALGRQAEPGRRIIADSSLAVGKLVFDPAVGVTGSGLRGVLKWAPPDSTATVRGYRVYAAEDERGLNRSLLGPEVPVGTEQLELDTPRERFTHLLVYVVTALAEQSSPTSMPFPEMAGPDLTLLTAVTIGATLAVQCARALLAFELASRVGEASEQNQRTEAESSQERGRERQTGHPRTSILGSFTSSSAGEAVTIQRPWFKLPLVRSLCSPLFPSHVHHHEPVVVLRRAGQKTCESLVLLKQCSNTWASDSLVLRKVSSARILLLGAEHGGAALVLRRRLPRWARPLEQWYWRSTFQLYAPLATILFVAILVLAALQELLIGGAVLAMSCAGVGVVYLAPRVVLLRELARTVKELPPPKMRGPVWRTCWTVLLLLPVVPAVLSETWTGFVTGAVIVLSAIVVLRGAHRLALLLNSGGSAALMVLSLHLWKQVPPEETSSNNEARARYTASFVAAALLSVQAADCLAALVEELLDEGRLPTDQRFARAEALVHDLGGSSLAALAVEAFDSGHVEAPLRWRLVATLHEAAQHLAHRGRRTLAVFGEELGDGRRARWSKLVVRLEQGLENALDAATGDFGCAKLRHLRAADRGNEASQRAGSAKIFEEVTAPAIEQLEEALKHLREERLPAFVVSEGLAVAGKLGKAAQRLGGQLQGLEAILHKHRYAHDRACVGLFGVVTEALGVRARELQREVHRQSLTPREALMLRCKASRLEQQAVAAHGLLPAAAAAPDALRLDVGSPVRGRASGAAADSSKAARRSCERAQEILGDVVDLLEAYRLAPSQGMLKDAFGLLADLLEEAGGMQAFQREFCETTPKAGVLDPEARREALAEILERFPGQHDESEVVGAAVQALCLARTVVALVAALHAELAGMAERMMQAFAALEAARSDWSKVMKKARKMREQLPRGSLQDLTRLQDLAIECLSDQPVKALYLFQDQLADPLQRGLDALGSELQRMEPLLAAPPVPRTSRRRSSSDSGRDAAGASKEKPSRVAPFQSSEGAEEQEKPSRVAPFQSSEGAEEQDVPAAARPQQPPRRRHSDAGASRPASQERHDRRRSVPVLLEGGARCGARAEDDQYMASEGSTRDLDDDMLRRLAGAALAQAHGPPKAPS